MMKKPLRTNRNSLVPIPFSPLLNVGLILFAGIILILLFSSNGGGNHWSGEERVTNAESYAGSPAVGIDGEDNIYLVWEEGSGIFNESRDIHFMKMSPTGDVIVNRTIASAFAFESAWPDIAVERNGTAHIVWQDSLFRNIYYMEISRDGDTLIPGMPIVQGGDRGLYPIDRGG